ncbi:hypothetical protein [Vibrio harveyi]|uniref:hypothetical protein n=1 Tax=Vibrio harveyi TaxID=669 RepID=UPI003CE9F667
MSIGIRSFPWRSVTEHEQMFRHIEPKVLEKFSEIKSFLYNLEHYGANSFDNCYKTYIKNRIESEIKNEQYYQNHLVNNHNDDSHTTPLWFKNFTIDYQSGKYDFLNNIERFI